MENKEKELGVMETEETKVNDLPVTEREDLDDEIDIFNESLSDTPEEVSPVKEMDDDRFEEAQKFVNEYGEVKYFLSKKKYAEALKEKEETLRYWRILKIRKVVIIAGVVTCLVGGALFLKNRKNTEATETVDVTVEETTSSNDYNIPVGPNEDAPQLVENIIGGNILSDGDPKVESESSSESVKNETTSESTRSSESVEPKKAEESLSETEEKPSNVPETLPASTEGQTEAPAISQEEVNKQIQEGQAIQSETMEPEVYEEIKDYGKYLRESLLNDPEYLKDVAEHQNNN